GAFTFGGSLSIIPLIQEQIVHQLGWLTPQEFIDGLALGQLTPGPPVMLAAYVGYKALGALGAIIAAMAGFLPSFAMLCALLPVFERVRGVTGARGVAGNGRRCHRGAGHRAPPPRAVRARRPVRRGAVRWCRGGAPRLARRTAPDGCRWCGAG